MLNIPLNNIANQNFQIVLDNNQYDITLKSCRNSGAIGVEVMAITIIRNNEIIVSGFRCVPSYPLIPYKYLQEGNFVFLTQNDMYPDWRLFGVNQYLIYISPTELENIRNGISI